MVYFFHINIFEPKQAIHIKNNTILSNHLYHQKHRPPLSYLNISSGLICHLHQELTLARIFSTQQETQDAKVNCSPQVVNVADEHILLPLKVPCCKDVFLAIM